MDSSPRQRASHKTKSATVISLSSYRWLMDQFRHKKIDRLVTALANLAGEGQGVGARDRPSSNLGTKPGGVVGTTKMSKRKRKGSEEEEAPETLLWIAGRARTLARAVSDPDKSRILAYVKELEAKAAALMTGEIAPDAPGQKKRRPAKKPARSAKTARPKKPRK